MFIAYLVICGFLAIIFAFTMIGIIMGVVLIVELIDEAVDEYNRRH